MKCTNCGKNNASFHYRSIINGNVTEYHLCPECAARLSHERECASMRGMEAFPGFDGMLDEMENGFWDDGFFEDGLSGDSIFGGSGIFGGSFPGSGLLSSLFGMNSIMPMVGFIGLEPAGVRYVKRPQREREEAPAESGNVDSELSSEREKNVLREQIRLAVGSEDYERAAKLRDELRRMEGKG